MAQYSAMASEAKTLERPSVAERERVLALLHAQEPALRALGVKRLRLFGSVARGEAGPDSDVDLLAELDHSFKFSLIDHVGLEQDLADLLGRPVDISTAPWKMRPRMRKRVERDAIEIF
jgi:predicted nucleotidyltransferase